MSKSIAKNAVFSAILNICNIALPIIVMPVVYGAIKSTLNGYLTMGETFTAFFMAFASFGVYQYGLREVSKVRHDDKKVRQTVTSLFLITTAATMIVTIAYTLYIILYHNDDPYFYTCMVMGLNLVFNLFNVEWINEALENYNFIALKTMIVKIIYNILTLCFVRAEADFLFYIYLTLGINFINNIASFIYVKRKFKFDFSHLEIIKHIKPMFFLVILTNTYFLYTWLDKTFIDREIGSTQAGYYGVAQKIETMITVLMLTITQVSTARLSNYLGNYSREIYLHLLNKIIKVYFMLLFPASIGLLCVSKQVMIIFGRGDQFLPAVPIMMAFSIYMLSTGIDSIIANQIIYLFGKEKKNTILTLIGGLVNLILILLLINTNIFTATTAVLATLIANIVVIALEYRLIKKEIKLDIHLFELHNMKYLYYSLVFIPITFFINKYILNTIISCALDVIASGGIYFIMLLITKDKVFLELLNTMLQKANILLRRKESV